MTTTTARSLASRYLDDIWNRGDLSSVDALIAPEIQGHVNGATFHGREALKQRIGALYQAYEAPHFTLDDLIADVDGGRVVARWTFRGKNVGPYQGHPATNRTVEVTGINVFRIDDADRIAEIWVNADDLGELQQLGIEKI